MERRGSKPPFTPFLALTQTPTPGYANWQSGSTKDRVPAGSTPAPGILRIDNLGR